ncbi:hypothetical protein BDN70DRAFT_992833 [Pholiota conissans]|uniref:Uncharacterized protein n=1 Tax=Pholiota conissans TaxID=109636 RepID=A0A9P6D1H3_9AGAR|nr:hypothetical protein BDN70DRAFT_992833 [Pholiota conissans]
MLSRIFSFFRFMAHSTSFESTSQKASTNNQRSTPDSPFLPLPWSQSLEVKEYMRIVLRTASSTIEAHDQLAQHTVFKLEHIKDVGNRTQHEHIIATVVDHNGNKIRLSIERSKGQAIAAPKCEKQKRSLRRSFSSSSTATLASLSSPECDSLDKTKPAKDVVQYLGNIQFPGSRILTVFEPQPHIPLLLLAIIIETVHDKEFLYTLVRNQCYWFAMLVMGVSMSQGGLVQSFPLKRGKGKMRADGGSEVKLLQPLQFSDPDIGSSGLGAIPILPEGDITVKELGPSVGTHTGVPIVSVRHDEIREVAIEAQRRYKDELEKLATKRAAQEAVARMLEHAQSEIEAANARAEAANARNEAANARAEAVNAENVALKKQLAQMQRCS